MGQFLLALLIATVLALTTYVGGMAWQESDDDQSDIAVRLMPGPFSPLQRPDL